MSTDALHTAVPGPNDPSDQNASGSPAAGAFAAMLAPVAPARPTSDTEAGPGMDASLTGASSAAFHGSEEATQDSPAAGNARQKQGIVRAWLLAGATRWAKGGGTQNKRLDTQKAKAAAFQVKEARQVAVNRSGAAPGKGSSGSGSAVKSAGGKGPGKATPNNAGKGSGNSNGSAHKGPSGRSNGASGPNSGRDVNRGPAGSSGGSGTGATKSPKDASRKGGNTGPAAGSGGKGAGGGSGAAPGPKGSKNTGPAGGPSANGTKKPDSAGKAAGDQGKSGGLFGKGSTPKGGNAGAGASGKPSTPGQPGVAAPKPSSGATPTKTPGGTAAPTGPTAASATKDNKGTKTGDGTKTDKTTKDSKGTTPAGKDGKPGQLSDQTTKPKGTAPGAGQPTGKVTPIRESRETGYRDGTRAARLTAHVKAYRDGAKDGWDDTTEAAEREKARLDKAHEERKNARDKEQPVSTTQSSADHHKPQPIGVKEVTATHVVLGDGAAKDSASRGEVRSMKGFERRLESKVTVLAKVAEDTKSLQAHAADQAAKATQLLENAKAIQGGDKLAASLAKLEEAAKAQAGKADDIHKRALRGHEGCGTVLSNVATRYGDIYKAVVDSDLTAPAELAFYKG